jgi:hypothetical protein
MLTDAKMARQAPIAVVCAAAFAMHGACAGAQVAISSAQPSGSARDVYFADYRAHLESLASLVEACAKARDAKFCDPALVGSDDRVPLGAERRLIRYDWLRALLIKAQEKDDAPSKPEADAEILPNLSNARAPKPTTTQLLAAAKARLAHDLAQVEGPGPPLPDNSAQRGTLDKVLAGREFRNLEEPSVRDTILEKIGNGINSFFDRVARFSARSRWIGKAVVWGFFGGVCVGLVWGLIQLERRWRIRLVPQQDAPAPGAPSARDWQLWLEDARSAASQGKWREAVHFLYWAAISRLESNRLWPADRARTPREYLALVAPEDPRRPGLATLTGSFERIWYGGRAAAENDYRAAEQLAAGLISGGGGAA